MIKHIKNTSGQGTVEFAIIAAIILVIVIALWLLASALADGLFMQHAADSASHATTNNTAGTMGDVILY